MDPALSGSRREPAFVPFGGIATSSKSRFLAAEGRYVVGLVDDDDLDVRQPLLQLVHPRPQRVVLVAFPHPGMRVPAFVTATCRDVETQKALLCVYVPTTPVPTSGYFLIVPEDEVTELDWSPEQTLQTIISGGLTAPPEVRYFKPGAVPEVKPGIVGAAGEVPLKA